MSALPTQIGALAQRSIMRTARQPASAIPPLIFPVALLLVNSGGLKASTELPGFPTDSFLAFALAVPVHPGRAVLDDERRHRSRARHPDRVLLPALADARARLGAARRPARRDRRARRAAGGLLHLRAACCSASGSQPGRPGSRCCSSTRRSSRSASVRSARSSRCAPARARRSRASSPCSSSSSSSPR